MSQSLPPSFAAHPYAEFLHKVAKPARYTGGEVGARVKDWAAVEAKVCLAFPDVYDIGMSHLGYKILYKILNDDPRLLAERAYAPWPDMEAELRARGLPLVSHESARPLRDFDVVGLSLQFELTYTNCLTILDLGGIPIRARDRGEGDPLVVGGGPTATHPEPVAAFFDAFVVGDGEEACADVALAWARLKAEGVPRRERLVALARLGGVYVPSLYEVAESPDTGLEVVTGVVDPRAPRKVRRAFVPDLSKFPFPASSPVGGPEAVFDRMSIEIARGCTEGCRFCQAGMIYRPVRERHPQEIVDTVVEAVKRSGYDDVSLTSLSTADASCIAPLIKGVVDKLAPERVSLGVSSLRAYGLGEDLLDEMRKVRATGLTFAPEAGTQRMRDVVNKNVTEAQLIETAERVFGKGWDRMKLYFMIGLPTEEDEDVRGIVETGRRALEAGKRAMREKRGPGSLRRASVTVSVSTHVPKPHTPFQWCAMDPLAEVERKQAILRGEARQARVDLKTHDARESVLEGVFARGDRRLGDVIEEAWRRGARFDSWEEHLKLEIWQAAFAKFGVDVARYLGTLPVTARLPWDHIDVGLEDGFLAREYRKALKGRLSPPCGKAAGMFVHHTNVADAEADARRLVCYDCGVACDMGAMRQERIDFLRAMGAERPEGPRRLPLAASPGGPSGGDAEPEAGPALAAEGDDAPTGAAEGDDAPTRAAEHAAAKPARAQPKSGGRHSPWAAPKAPPRRYRLAFEKLGPVAFLGHLDLARALPRVFRRIEVPVAYSEGFRPKPDFSFGPALSLGVFSVDEYLDVKLLVDVEPAELVRRLNEAAPSGLRFTGGARLGPADPGLTKVIGSARYALAFARGALGGRPEGGLEAAAARLIEAPSLVVRRVIEGNEKRIDVRAALRSLAVEAPSARAALGRAGFVGELAVVEAEVALSNNGAVKASEIVEALFGEPDVSHRALRTALLTAEGLSPLAIVGRAPPRKTGREATAADAG
ncbi:MAG TPA: TIGR03960 family B12-binding radical SAM protein [Polyangiaceae bacterium]|nr:TIGR03960 family B12-binding radical SAM protein [Polyangiaceae bacterium]